MVVLEEKFLRSLTRAAEKFSGIDWEERRFEIAKSVLPSYLNNGSMTYDSDYAIDMSLKIADKLIAKLKE